MEIHERGGIMTTTEKKDVPVKRIALGLAAGKRAAEMAPGKRVSLGILGIIQAAYAFLAFWDLWHRPAKQMHGPKPLWGLVILINWIGPTAYFYVHRTR